MQTGTCLLSLNRCFGAPGSDPCREPPFPAAHGAGSRLMGLDLKTTHVCPTPPPEAPRAPPGLILLQERRGCKKLQQEAVNGLCLILTCH